MLKVYEFKNHIEAKELNYTIKASISSMSQVPERLSARDPDHTRLPEKLQKCEKIENFDIFQKRFPVRVWGAQAVKNIQKKPKLCPETSEYEQTWKFEKLQSLARNLTRTRKMMTEIQSFLSWRCKARGPSGLEIFKKWLVEHNS